MMRIIISSAGRRVYLVHWFRQALVEADVEGDVYVLDHDRRAPAAAAADGFRQLPPYTSGEYAQQLLRTVDELRPALFISLNDCELTTLSQGLSERLRERDVVAPLLDGASHRAVADKLHMSRVLSRIGVPTPRTVLLSDTEAVHDLLETTPAVILKDRWGSGSSGLRRRTAEQMRRWLATHPSMHSDFCGSPHDELIVQPHVVGTEYGIDIVTPVRGGPVAGVLARRKLSMRHGETAAAVSVDSSPFAGLAATLADALGIQGTVDVDLLLSGDGAASVIDINPRFGGGYPFSHVAGADVPHFFVASTLGFAPQPRWNTYRLGHVGAKHEGIIGFEPSPDGSAMGLSHQEGAASWTSRVVQPT